MKKSLVVSILVAVAVAFCVSAGFATEIPGVITMDSKVFAKHTKPLVKFDHKKHATEFKIPCTECHHVWKDGKNVWKEGDKVQKCDACHSEGKAPRGEHLSKKEKVKKYMYDAIHANCVGCHKAEKKQGKNAPTSCKDCHKK